MKKIALMAGISLLSFFVITAAIVTGFGAILGNNGDPEEEYRMTMEEWHNLEEFEISGTKNGDILNLTFKSKKNNYTIDNITLNISGGNGTVTTYVKMPTLGGGREKMAWQYLLRSGFSKEGAAGVLASIQFGAGAATDDGKAELIASTAEALAWTEGTSKSSWKKPTKALESAAKEVGTTARADCGNFNMIVLRKALGNNKIPNMLGKALASKGDLSKMQSSIAQYGLTAFKWDGSMSSLKRGDVLVYKNPGDTSSGSGQHIFTYLGNNKVAEASYPRKLYGYVTTKSPGKGVLSAKNRKFYYVLRATGNGNASYGIMQWRGERMERVRSWLKKKGLNINSDSDELFLAQLEYAISEPGYESVIRQVKTETSAANAATLWTYNYENPDKAATKATARAETAKTYYKKYIDVGAYTEAKTETVPLTIKYEGRSTDGSYLYMRGLINKNEMAAMLFMDSAEAGEVYGTAMMGPKAADYMQRKPQNPYGGETEFWINSWVGYRCWSDHTHRGVDMQVKGSENTPHALYAIYAGTVSKVSYADGRGNYIIIDCIDEKGQKIGVVYQHLTRATVSTGDSVYPGQQVAVEGGTGGSYPNHLHLELLKNSNIDSYYAFGRTMEQDLYALIRKYGTENKSQIAYDKSCY